MFTTYRKLLEDLVKTNNAKYSSDPEHGEAMLAALYATVFAMLEKLADKEDAVSVEQD